MKVSETKRQEIGALAAAWGEALVDVAKASKERQARRLEIRTKLVKSA